MRKLIIDKVTGTILNAEDCYIVDEKDITVEDFTDREIAELAERVGKSIQKMGQDTGWGDNAYRFGVSYSPFSIIDEVTNWLSTGVYIPSDDCYEAMKWAKENATNEQLQNIGEYVIHAPSIWDDFREHLEEGIVWGYHNQRKD